VICQKHLTRALKAMKAAGVAVEGIDISPDGHVRVIGPGGSARPLGDAEDALEQARKEGARRRARRAPEAGGRDHP